MLASRNARAGDELSAISKDIVKSPNKFQSHDQTPSKLSVGKVQSTAGNSAVGIKKLIQPNFLNRV